MLVRVHMWGCDVRDSLDGQYEESAELRHDGRVVGHAAATGNAWANLTRGESGLPEAREAEHARACQAKHGSATRPVVDIRR